MMSPENQEPGIGQREAVVNFFDSSYHWWRQVYDQNLPRGFFSFEMIRRKEIVLKVVHNYLGRRSGLNILECGCGLGGVLRDLQTEGHRVFGLDINPESLCVARNDCPQAQLVCGDLESLPFAAASIDIILCVGVLSYLQDDRNALGELTRLLRPGGLLVLANPNLFMFDKLFDPFYLLVWPFKKLRRLFQKQGKPVEEFKSCMIRRYRYDQLDPLYQALGLKKTKQIGISYGPLRLWRKELLSVTLSIRVSNALVDLSTLHRCGFLTRLANHWVIALEKPAAPIMEGI